MLMRMSLEILIATISCNELQNGLHVIRAGFEHQTTQHIGAMLKDQRTDQTIDKRLCSFNTREIEHDL